MLRSYFLFNIILIIIAGALGFKLYKSIPQPLNIPSKAIQREAVSDESDKKSPKSLMVKKGVSDFQVIVKKDLFRPGRTEPEVEEVSTPDFFPRLIGTVITEDEAMAYLEDPKSNTTKAFRINDLIAGFTVHEILRDRVVLLRGDEKVEVKLGMLKTEKGPDNLSTSGARVPPMISQDSVRSLVEPGPPE